ncbi:hypothetical protein JMJ35_007792 [Cladonia borealis]|uniref:Uncharacterized protein n=1 Tax=Cladonia borealis TaxID=184061 RepID=A0AA39UZ05_9LECA|nr:hypothetical protein JMJ35_007792 [Cladonia borealis]
MFALTRIVFFVLPAFALIAQPLTTPPPSLKARQVGGNICGYFHADGVINTISCTVGTPCVVATNLDPAVGYCLASGANGNVPLTIGFRYGDWPMEGCGPGQVCWSATPKSHATTSIVKTATDRSVAIALPPTLW